MPATCCRSSRSFGPESAALAGRGIGRSGTERPRPCSASPPNAGALHGGHAERVRTGVRQSRAPASVPSPRSAACAGQDPQAGTHNIQRVPVNMVGHGSLGPDGGAGPARHSRIAHAPRFVTGGEVEARTLRVWTHPSIGSDSKAGTIGKLIAWPSPKAFAPYSQVSLAQRRGCGSITRRGCSAFAFPVSERLVHPSHTGSWREGHSLTARIDVKPRAWVVRADSDEQAGRFRARGYTGIGWIDLSSLDSQDQIWSQLKKGTPTRGLQCCWAIAVIPSRDAGGRLRDHPIRRPRFSALRAHHRSL